MTKKTIYIGIDPGASGGLAIIYPSGGIVEVPYKSLKDTWGLWSYLRERATFSQRNNMAIACCIEKVGGFIGNEAGEGGGNSNKAAAHTMFTFGMNYGVYLGLLTATEVIKVHEIAPKQWRDGLGISPRTRSESKVQWKKRLKGIAQALYPKMKVTLATADALLLATYCQRFIKPKEV